MCFFFSYTNDSLVSYTFKLKHDKYEWEVSYDYKELKELHRTLAKLVKADLGKSCSDFTKYF